MTSDVEKNTDSENKLWGGRFTEPTDAFVERFTASESFDRRMAAQDIRGSIAHAEMLASQQVLTNDELKSIKSGLAEVLKDIQENNFEWSVSREDVHMNIEAALTAKIGDAGKKLHTGRSRNDQVATDIRLWLRDQIDLIAAELSRLQNGVIGLAMENAETIMPGFTHLQTAQPITFGHHLMAWNEMLERDYSRLVDCRVRMNLSPLGASALAGTSYPIDRNMTATDLGFDAPTRNSLDSVSDRDFAIEFCSFASICLMHLSRMSEEMVLWTSSQFDFVDLPDRFCTGSSIMPQKKNPDVPELVRGKSGRVYGHLVALLTLMKSQPLAYNKDNQEDKEPIFDTVDTVRDCLRAFADMIPAIQAKKDNMRSAAAKGFSTATDLADYLVGKGLAFRDAHEVVGLAVAHGIEQECDLGDLSLEQLQSFSGLIESDVFDYLTLEGSVRSRDHMGGTAPAQVRRAAEVALNLVKSRS